MDRVLSSLSLAKKAGAVLSGEFAVLEGIRMRKVHLVMVPLDASANTKKKYTDKSQFYRIPLIFYGTKDSLGAAIGENSRAGIGITDLNLANLIQTKLK